MAPQIDKAIAYGHRAYTWESAACTIEASATFQRRDAEQRLLGNFRDILHDLCLQLANMNNYRLMRQERKHTLGALFHCPEMCS